MAAFTREQLIEQAKWVRANLAPLIKSADADHAETMSKNDRLMEIALAALTGGMEQEPAYFINKVTYSDVYGNDVELRAYDCEVDAIKSKADFGGVVIPVYAAPQLPQPAVVDERAAFESWNNEDNLPIDGFRAQNAAWLGWQARAAMLQGAKSGERLGAEFEETLAELIDSEMEPVSQPNTLREGVAAIRNSGIAIDAEKIQAERDALNTLDVPDGWVLVPIEPTAEMVAAAMLSDDVLFDQDDDTMFRVQHGVIWRAMMAAAPDFREIENSSTKHFRESAETSTKCWCHTCRPVTVTDMRFVVCPECGNKRCPHANDHRNACTGSNEPGQEGSAYPAAPQQEDE